MIRGFLLDENLPPWWRPAIVQRQPHLRVFRVGDPGAPPLKSPDPIILAWCEAHDCVLVTNNRRTMPQHLADLMAQGKHVHGIFNVDPALNIDTVAEDLSLIEGASLPDEFQDQIRYLPLS